jgi:hypothetical protein
MTIKKSLLFDFLFTIMILKTSILESSNYFAAETEHSDLETPAFGGKLQLQKLMKDGILLDAFSRDITPSRTNFLGATCISTPLLPRIHARS